ncbi:MAG: hypothetical protein WCI39_12710, partial [Gallionellaceae bacterium]
MNPQFETMDDFLARLPKEEQERIQAGAAKVAEEIRLNNLRRYSDPLFVHGSLYKLDTEYLQINWMVSFQAKVLMIYTPYSMPEHLTKIMEQILKEDRQFKNNGIETLGALIIDFELNICHDFAEGQKWVEVKVNPSG